MSAGDVGRGLHLAEGRGSGAAESRDMADDKRVLPRNGLAGV